VLWLVLLFRGTRTLIRMPDRGVQWLAALWFLPYAFWLIVGQAVMLPRQHLPVVVTCCLFAALGLPSIRFRPALLGTMMVALAMVTVPRALNHQTQPLQEQQVGDFLAKQLRHHRVAMIDRKTWPLAKSIAPQVLWVQRRGDKAEPLRRQGYTVFSPAGVLSDKEEASGLWIPSARICQGEYLRPWGTNLIIYQYNPGMTPPPFLPCYKMSSNYLK